MKRTTQILALSVFLLFTLLFSCKKEEHEQMIDVLTSKTWKFGMKDLNASTNPSGTNFYFAVPECEQDDTFLFREDGTMIRNYGPKKCDGETTANKTVPFSFNKQTKELIIDGVKYKVVEENKTQFKYVLVTITGTAIYLLQ